MDYKSIKISEMSVNDRPREKLLLRGIASLTNTEILAILLGSGSRDESVLDLSSRILKDNNNSFEALGKRSVRELVNSYRGVGPAKAIVVIAATELARRSRFEKNSDIKRIRNSEDVFNFFEPLVSFVNHEEFWVLYLNRSNGILSYECLSKGGISGTVIDRRILFSHSLERKATSIIVCHNHPSGNIHPSDADVAITKKISNAGKIMDIDLLDHIIIGGGTYFSFADNSLMT